MGTYISSYKSKNLDLKLLSLEFRIGGRVRTMRRAYKDIYTSEILTFPGDVFSQNIAEPFNAMYSTGNTLGIDVSAGQIIGNVASSNELTVICQSDRS